MICCQRFPTILLCISVARDRSSLFELKLRLHGHNGEFLRRNDKVANRPNVSYYLLYYVSFVSALFLLYLFYFLKTSYCSNTCFLLTQWRHIVISPFTATMGDSNT